MSSISSVSSASAAAPVKAPEASPPNPPVVKPDADASASQPVVVAALPPGQGTRVNQLA
jgi:hypothetical protein